MVDMTYEEYLGETFKVWLNGTLITDYFRVLEVTGRSLSPNEIKSLIVPGMNGSHFQSKRKPSVPLGVKGFMICDSDQLLRQRIDELNGILDTEDAVSLVFSDEPNKTYFGMFNDVSEGVEVNGNHIFTISFARFDPYKYGPEQTATLNSNTGTIINVGGTAPTKPIFELDVTEPTTYIAIANENNDYMMLGSPSRMDVQTYEQNTLILNDPCTSLTGWTVANNVDNGYVDGNVLATPEGFIPDTFGAAITPYAWQGPSIKTSLSSPLQDFRMDVLVELLNVGNGTGMIEIYLKDSANNIVAKIGIEDVWRGKEQNQGKFQLGNLTNRENYYRSPDYAPAWNNFYGMLRIYRDGNRFRPYFALVQPDGKHNWVSSAYVYTDYENEYSAPITQVQVAMRKWPDKLHASMTVKDIKVWEMNKQDEKVPYIANAGDKVIFDHQTGELLINGENRKDIKDFGARYFDLQPGNNTLAIVPDNFTGIAKWRHAYK